MQYTYTPKAIRQAKKLPVDFLIKLSELQKTIEKARSIHEIPNACFIKNCKGLYRIKIRTYRIIIEKHASGIIIKSIIKRTEGTYKKL